MKKAPAARKSGGGGFALAGLRPGAYSAEIFARFTTSP